MLKTTLWISYDLGVSGDYDGMYTWLDTHNAVECGDSFAFILNYEYQGDIVATLRKELKESVKLEKRSRVYAIYKKPTGSSKGSFLFGGRKQAPWAGFAPGSSEDVDDEG